MIRLINSLYLRMGTDKSARHFRTYGITTLGNRHLEIKRDGKLIFEFVGKSRVKHRRVLVDRELAILLKELAALGPSRKLRPLTSRKLQKIETGFAPEVRSLLKMFSANCG